MARLASGPISGASKRARRAGAKPPVCTILCFCFKDTFLSATFLNFCRYLVNLAFSLGFNVTLPLRIFKAHSDRHWRRSLSAPRKIALHTWGWALAKARIVIHLVVIQVVVIHVVVIHPEVHTTESHRQLKAMGWWGCIYRVKNIWKTFWHCTTAWGSCINHILFLDHDSCISDILQTFFRDGKQTSVGFPMPL